MSEEAVGGDTLETVRDRSFIAMTMIILARRKDSRRNRRRGLPGLRDRNRSQRLEIFRPWC